MNPPPVWYYHNQQKRPGKSVSDDAFAVFLAVVFFAAGFLAATFFTAGFLAATFLVAVFFGAAFFAVFFRGIVFHLLSVVEKIFSFELINSIYYIKIISHYVRKANSIFKIF